MEHFQRFRHFHLQPDYISNLKKKKKKTFKYNTRQDSKLSDNVEVHTTK